MDDLDDVRSWLGYDRIDLFGLSYGSRAVLVYMRQHPDRVHTATIMGVAPTVSEDAVASLGGRQRAPWTSCFRRVSRTRSVIKRSRKSGTEWTTVLAQLGRQPARVQYSPPDKSGPVTVEIKRDIFAEKIRNWMYGQR